VSSRRTQLPATASELAELDEGRLVLVDAGAAGGVARRWRPAGGRLLVVGFEPDSRSHAALEPSDGRIWLDTALWERPGPVELRLTRKSSNSSVLTPNRKFLDRFPDVERFDVVGTEEVQAGTLDDALAAIPIPRADFLKMDVQGGELAILRGARSTLSSGVFGVEVEVAFAPLYQGQPTFGAIDEFLRGEGFELIDLRRTYWKPDRYRWTRGPKGQLVAGDALYFRGTAAFVESLAASDRARAHEAMVNALVTCAIYGYVDRALELLDEASARSLGEVAEGVRGMLEAAGRCTVERLPSPARPRAARLMAALRRRADGLTRWTNRFAPAPGWPPGGKRPGRYGDADLGNP
jgi:FkbM family methyltransferase